MEIAEIALKLFSFDYLKWAGEKDTDRNCHLLLYSPDTSNFRGWFRPKSGASNSSQVFHVGNRDPTPPPRMHIIREMDISNRAGTLSTHWITRASSHPV